MASAASHPSERERVGRSSIHEPEQGLVNWAEILDAARASEAGAAAPRAALRRPAIRLQGQEPLLNRSNAHGSAFVRRGTAGTPACRVTARHAAHGE